MQSEQLEQHYAALRDDLSDAYGQIPWRSEHIDDLANKLLVVEQLMSRVADDEQCDDGLLALGPLVGRERPKGSTYVAQRNEGPRAS